MDYFEVRNIDPSTYRNHQIPPHLKHVILNLRPNAKILDFGCGFGQNLSAIHSLLQNSKGGGIKGIDINDKAIHFCQNQGLDAQKIEDIFSYTPDTKFDLIIATHVIEHFPKDQIIPLLSRFRERFLTQGGMLYVAVPNAQSNTGAYWAYEDFTHHTLFSSGSLYYVLKMAGFHQVDFLDIHCLEGLSTFKKYFRKFFLQLYAKKQTFWNKVTNSAYHGKSPIIYSYEIKALAKV